jgi:hypothetical protein
VCRLRPAARLGLFFRNSENTRSIICISTTGLGTTKGTRYIPRCRCSRDQNSPMALPLRPSPALSSSFSFL